MNMDSGFRAKALAFLTLALVFGSGIGMGLLWDRNLDASTPDDESVSEPAEGRERGRRPLLVEQVGLTLEQKAEIDLMVSESRRQMKVLNEEFQPRYREIISETREDIKTLLTEEQRTQYESLLADFDARRERRRDRDSDDSQP
jgi:Spy/CpxP family protein refolding chaperone